MSRHWRGGILSQETRLLFPTCETGASKDNKENGHIHGNARTNSIPREQDHEARITAWRHLVCILSARFLLPRFDAVPPTNFAVTRPTLLQHDSYRVRADSTLFSFFFFFFFFAGPWRGGCLRKSSTGCYGSLSTDNFLYV